MDTVIWAVVSLAMFGLYARAMLRIRRNCPCRHCARFRNANPTQQEK